MTPLLSKSKYLNGLQCLKLLWISANKKELLPEIDEATQYRFDEGQNVGELAKTLFPKGIDLTDEDFGRNLEKTQEAMINDIENKGKRRALFEAAFKIPFNNGELYARADILVPVGKDEWEVIEVKSATQTKDVNIQDVSFQLFVYERAGLKIRKCFVMHLNNEYVRKGEIKAKKLFIKEDVTDQVVKNIVCGAEPPKIRPGQNLISYTLKLVKMTENSMDKRIEEMFKILSQKNIPIVKIGPYCTEPYACPLYDFCWKEIPDNSVFDLYRIRKTEAFELFEKGIISISEVPETYKLNEKQAIQKKCFLSGKECIDKDAIRNFLKDIKYPAYFMDFETYQTAIPLYNGLKPYQQVPFQFSVHIVDKKGKIKHISYIAQGDGDPRKEFAKNLKKTLGKNGTIIAFNQSFEQGRLKETANFMPKYSKWVESVNKRMIDLLVPFRNFYYYNPKQHGSASIKAVLPALTGKSYEDIAIHGGASASVLYFYATHGRKYGLKPTQQEVDKIIRNLEEYCGLDTEGMIWIVDRLREIVSEKV